MNNRSSTWLLLMLLLSGCGSSSRPGRGPANVDTLANGTIVVHNRKPQWDSASAWRLTEQLRIGSTKGEGPDVFGDVADVYLTPNGHVWVLDRQAHVIQIFDARAHHIRTLGRPGGGPGEFKDAIALAPDGHGHVWVVDPGNARYSVFDTAGAYVTSHLRRFDSYSLPWPGGFTQDGQFYDYVFTMQPGGKNRRALPRMLFSGDSITAPDSVFIPEPSEQPQYFEVVHQSRNSRSISRAAVPFAPGFRWTLDPRGGLWIGYSSAYRIQQLSPQGDTVRTVELQYTPVRVTAHERDTAMAQLRWIEKQGGKLDASRIPSTKPAFRGFFVTRDGFLWVRTHLPGDGDPALHTPTNYDVFDPAGVYLGRIALDLDDYPVPRVIGNAVVGVRRDELDVPFVVVYRLERPVHD